MRANLRGFLNKLGMLILVVSPLLQIALAFFAIQVAAAEPYAVLRTLIDVLPQVLIDMAVGGGLMLLCSIDERLEARS